MYEIKKEIESLIPVTQGDEATNRAFVDQLEKGVLTRDEGSSAHFCVYFFPYNPETREVFIVLHKKSGLWLSPGGHIDAKDKSLRHTLNREINEELGMENFFTGNPAPFLITTVDIDRPNQPCKRHLDMWYVVETDGKAFSVDPTEFHETRWVPIEDAEKIITDDANKEALAWIKRL